MTRVSPNLKMQIHKCKQQLQRGMLLPVHTAGNSLTGPAIPKGWPLPDSLERLMLSANQLNGR